MSRTPGQALRDTDEYKNGRCLETWSKHADRSGFTACVDALEDCLQVALDQFEFRLWSDEYKGDFERTAIEKGRAALAKVRGDA